MNRTIIIKIKKSNITYSNVDGYQTAGTTLFGLSAGSASIERILCDKQLEFGVCNSAKFEAQIFNITTDVTNCQIEVLASDVTDPIFVGKIDSSKKDETNEYRNIIAYDNLYTARDKDIAEAWNGTDIWEDENPITLKTLRNRLCVAAGLTVSTSQPTLPNDNESIPAKFATVTSAKFGTIIKMVCELQGSFPIITADGKVKFIQLTTSATDITDNCDTNESEFEDYETSPIDAINVYSTSNDLTQTVGESNPTNAYPISGNIFLLSFDATFVTRVLQATLSAISPIVYTPATLELIIGDLSLQIGDCVQIYRAGNQYIHYVFGTTLYDSLLVRQSINCPAIGKKLDESSSASNDPLIFGEMFTKMEQTIEGISIIASSKNKTYRQSATPVGATTGDLWYYTGTTTSTRTNGKWYRYNGTSWVLTEDAGIGKNRAELQIQSEQIEARVTKTGGTDATFSWSLTADGFVLKSNGSTVFQCNSSGIQVAGYATIGDIPTDVSELNNDAGYQDMDGVVTIIDGTVTASYVNALGITANKIEVKTAQGNQIFLADAGSHTTKIGGFTVDGNSIFSGETFNPSNVPDVFLCLGTNSSYTIAGHYASGWGLKIGDDFGVLTDTGTLYCASALIGKVDATTGESTYLYVGTAQSTGGETDVSVGSVTSYTYLKRDVNDKLQLSDLRGGYADNLFYYGRSGVVLRYADGYSQNASVDATRLSCSGLTIAGRMNAAHGRSTLSFRSHSIQFDSYDDSTSTSLMNAGSHNRTGQAYLNWYGAKDSTQHSYLLIGAGTNSYLYLNSGSADYGRAGLLAGDWYLSADSRLFAKRPATEEYPNKTAYISGSDALATLIVYATSKTRMTLTMGAPLSADRTFTVYYRLTGGTTTSQSVTVTAGTYYVQVQKSSDIVAWGFSSTSLVTTYGDKAYSDDGNGVGFLKNTWYNSSGSIVYSWRGIKTNISDFTENHERLFDALKPRTFTYTSGESNRVHFGLILDELKSALDQAELTTQDCAAYCLYNTDDEDGPGGIRYEELIALTINETQKLKARVAELERRINNG